MYKKLSTQLLGAATALSLLCGAAAAAEWRAWNIHNDGHPNTGEFGEGATFTFVEAQALWNYRFLYQDHSHGVHNPAYARALLHNSREALQD